MRTYPEARDSPDMCRNKFEDIIGSYANVAFAALILLSVCSAWHMLSRIGRKEKADVIINNVMTRAEKVPRDPERMREAAERAKTIPALSTGL